MTTVAHPASAAHLGLVAVAPVLTSFHGARRRLPASLLPQRSMGISGEQHVALTFDDGPDPNSTPQFLRLLADLGVRATFFVLGRHVEDGGLLRSMVAQGHELGVHGWDHVPTLLRSLPRLSGEILRTKESVEDLTGVPVRWYRPPYGLVSAETFAAARSAGLELVLWSAWGRDWRAGATPASICDTVLGQVRAGGTVLLHDTDRTSATGSWQRTLVATESLLRTWASRQQPVGPLSDHWSTPCGTAGV
jgi:peptidoglycan/xylan/chitin deacetylase (PgdA/CDA1 family)